MNNSQAHNALRYINQTMDEKIKTFEKLCSHSYINENDYEETFCSLLGAYYNNVKSKNFDDVFNATITEKNITDDNIKELQGKKVKVKSVAELKEKIASCLGGKHIFYNDFINDLAIQISSVLNNEDTIKSTPFELLTDLNQIRFEAGLSRVLESDDDILNNCYIDNKNVIPSFNEEKIAQAYEKVKTLIFEKFNLYVDEYNGDTAKIEDGKLYVSKSLGKETYGVVLQTLHAVMAVCEKYVCSCNSLESYLKLYVYNTPVAKALEAYNELNDKQSVEADFKILSNLIATENFVKLVYDKEEYAQVLKLLNYSICKKLSFIASKLNKQGVIYAMSTAIIDDVTKVFTYFGMTLDEVKTLNNKLGLRTTNQDEITSLESLVLAEQEYLLDFQNVDLANRVLINYNNLKEKDFYHYYYGGYISKMNKLLESDVDDNVDIEVVKNDMVSAKTDLNKSNNLVTNHNHISKEELIACVDCFGFVNAARETVEKIEKELNISVSAREETVNADEHLDEKIVVDYEDKMNIASNNIATSESTLDNIENNVSNKTIGEDNRVIDIVDDEENTQSNVSESDSNAIVDEKTDTIAEVVSEENNSSNSNEVSQQNTIDEKIDETTLENEEKLQVADNTVKNEEKNNLEAELSQKQAQIDNQNNVISKQNTELTQKEEELTQKDSLLSQKDKELTQKDSLLNQATAEITQKDTLLNQKDAELSQKEKDMLELQHQIDQLKAQLAQKQSNSQPVEPAPVTRNVYTIMQEKINVAILNSLKPMIASLVSTNKDELSDKIIFSNGRCDSIKRLIVSYDMLYNVESGSSTIYSKLVNLNDKQTVKNLMLLKSSFEKIFIDTLASKLSEEVVDNGMTTLNGLNLVKSALNKTRNKYSVNLEKSYKKQIKNLVLTQSDPDSFEYQEEMEKIKEKYYGEGSKVGLFEKLNGILLELMLKDVIITELNEIANCEKSGEKYSFNEAKAQRIVDEIFLENKEEETDSMMF